MPLNLNAIEKEVYDFICHHITTHTHPPTIREIAEGCFMSRANVIRYLDRLELQGYILREPGKARGITLPGKNTRL